VEQEDAIFVLMVQAVPSAASLPCVAELPAGCVAHVFRFGGDAPPALALEAEEALSFLPRAAIVAKVKKELDQTLCGVGAPSCEG
jgi:hypothetical protein